jgi:hypothetical protein
MANRATMHLEDEFTVSLFFGFPSKFFFREKEAPNQA